MSEIMVIYSAVLTDLNPNAIIFNAYSNDLPVVVVKTRNGTVEWSIMKGGQIGRSILHELALLV